MKLVAIRYYTIDTETLERKSDEDYWHVTDGDLKKEMRDNILPWAAHNGVLIEIVGKIYTEDAQ